MPFMLGDTPSLGLLIGLPVGIIVAAAGSIFAIGCLLSDDYDRWLGVALGAVVAAAAVIGTAIALWPWEHDYHFWKPVNGTVEKISSRLISAGDEGGSNQRFVVVVDGQAYGVDDTRASLLKVGDTVHLKCKREYEWGASNNGYGCRWNGGDRG